VDFTDVIYDYIDMGQSRRSGVLIVDESRTSALQWKMIHKLEGAVEECYVAETMLRRSSAGLARDVTT